PAFIKSTKDNKKLYGKTAFCLKIYLKLMDVGYHHMPIKLKFYYTPRTKFLGFLVTKKLINRFGGDLFS
ncbi:hypothetical protein, partial [Bacillus cereus group sp. BfR-BA-01331]|uniref:hypothetical protein n=1 Tax=Bacillus cereus group sp. BfR-BA-01331 TaxID=2920307 RepID=UPI001F571AAD